MFHFRLMRQPLFQIWRVAGALATILAFPLYRVLTLVLSQIGLARTLGMGALASVVLLGLATLGWVLWRAQGPAGERRLDVARKVYLALALLSAGAVGLSLYYFHPRLAPVQAQAIAGVVILVLFVRYLSLPEAMRRFVARLWLGVGQVAVAIPLLATPWIAYVAWNMPARPIANPATPPASARRAEAPRRIVLLSFDALRARSLDLSAARGNTPNFAAFARQATVFPFAVAASDRTQSSIPTLLSGLRPHAIIPTVNNRSGFIRQGDLTGVAGHLAPAGYAASYVTMIINPGMFGLTGEFASGHHYTDFLKNNDFNTPSFLPIREVFDWAAARQAREAASHTVSRLERLEATRDLFTRARRHLADSDGRTFLWLHVGVPHLPYYDVPEAALGAQPDSRRTPRVSIQMMEQADAAQMQAYEAVYERYVRYLDAEWGLFMRGAIADGTWDDTLFVLTSDHGERFMVGADAHGQGATEEDVTRIPLMIKAPGQRQGTVIETPVGTEDIVPTVLGAVYEPGPRRFVGRPLLPAPEGAPRTLFTWARYEHVVEDGVAGAIAAYREPFKYVHDYSAGQERLYDLRRDPRASRDVRAQHAKTFAELRAEVRQAFPSHE